MDTLSRLSHDTDSEVAMVNIKQAVHYSLLNLILPILPRVWVFFFCLLICIRSGCDRLP